MKAPYLWVFVLLGAGLPEASGLACSSSACEHTGTCGPYSPPPGYCYDPSASAGAQVYLCTDASGPFVRADAAAMQEGSTGAAMQEGSTGAAMQEGSTGAAMQEGSAGAAAGASLDSSAAAAVLMRASPDSGDACDACDAENPGAGQADHEAGGSSAGPDGATIGSE